MPTFRPPTTPVTPMSVPKDNPGRNDAWRLFRFYPLIDTGRTIWKDRDGVWHDDLNPSHGDETSTTIYDINSAGNPHHIKTDPTSGLGNAAEVFLGGHEYEISNSMALELIALGYGANIEGELDTPDEYLGGTASGTGVDIYSGGTALDTGEDVYFGGYAS